MPATGDPSLTMTFDGTVMHWRGPAPFYWVPLPAEENADLLELVTQLSYGWGCIPVDARIGGTTWYTALMPKNGVYLVPVKAAIRTAEKIEDGDTVRVELQFDNVSGRRD